MAEAARSLLSPLPFAGFTGRDVRVAIIDSGVHPDHPHVDATRIGAGVLVMPDGTIEEGPDATLDRMGHGTAVTAALQEKAPEALCVPVRVFRESLKTSAAALIAAIRWSIHDGADIINLSLGSPNAAHGAAFTAVADEATQAGVLLVAAREANDAPCYPGILPQVLGVTLDWDCPRDRYGAASQDGLPALSASGYPRPIPGVPLQRNLYGISFAVAQMSGFAALACEAAGPDRDPQRPDRIRQALLREAPPSTR
ncbi:MAG TPA: S8 family serine peptidase [Sphingobium sp.]